MPFTPQTKVIYGNSITGFCIRSVREDAGLTKVDLADRLGCLVEYIEQVESGRGLIYTHQLVALCDILEMPAWKVMQQSENMRAQLKKWGVHVFPGPCPTAEDAVMAHVVLLTKFETPQVARVLVAV